MAGGLWDRWVPTAVVDQNVSAEQVRVLEPPLAAES